MVIDTETEVAVLLYNLVYSSYGSSEVALINDFPDDLLDQCTLREVPGQQDHEVVVCPACTRVDALVDVDCFPLVAFTSPV